MANIFKLIAFLLRSADDLAYSRMSVMGVLFASVLAGIASTGLLALINQALQPEGAGTRYLASTFLAMCILLPVLRFLSGYLVARFAQGISYDLRMRFSRKVLSSPLHHLERVGAPRILACLAGDIGTIASSLSQIPQLVLQSTIVIGCLAYMAWLSWQLFLLVLLFVVFGIVSYRLPVLRALRHFRSSREAWDRLLQGFRGVTEGTKELKIHRPRREALFSEKLEPAASDLRRHNLTSAALYGAANGWGQALFFVLIGLVLFVLPRYSTVTEPMATGYILSILFILTPLDVILNSLPSLGRATVSLAKVEALGLSFEATGQDDGEDPTLVAGRPWRVIELRGVQHTYSREDADDLFTLGPIDFRLRPGNQVFIVGGNGSGKTTLAKLLMGLYEPEAGEVVLDDVPVSEANRDSYRQLFSVVFSDFYLFETLLGLDDEDLDERSRLYLEKLHLAKKVQIQDGELSTIDLSQGQRKRLALLTAYLEDREVYLFDEWAADQDPQFKEIFYLQLLPDLRHRGKTVVVITHDDRYYRLADRIVKLEDGKILYDGPVAAWPDLPGVGMV